MSAGKLRLDGRATKIWTAIFANLDNRGCFNGIDEETLDDIGAEQIVAIIHILNESP